MKNCIEIKDDMAKTIRVNKGNFYFTFDLDKKLFVECLEGERYINTNPAVSISRFRNAFERFAAITEGNRRIVQSAKKDIDRTSVYDKVHNEIGKPNAKYVKDGKEYNVTAKGLFVDTLFELQKKDKNAFYRTYNKICNKAYGVLFEKEEDGRQKSFGNFGRDIYSILSGSSHVTVGERTTALCVAEVLFYIFSVEK